jgi:hypothetical protein
MATTTIVASPVLSSIADALRQEESNEAHAIYMASQAIDSARAWRKRVEQAHEGLRNLLSRLVRDIEAAPEEGALEDFHWAMDGWMDSICDIKMMADAHRQHAAGLPEIREAGLNALRAAYDARKGNAPA